MDCQTKGVNNKLPAGLLQPIPVRGPWSRVGIDAVGPFKPSLMGNKYILTATCYFTKYAEAKAVPDISAETTAKFIVDEIICRHGAVEELLSDLGRNFLAEVVQQVLKLLGTRHVRTSSYWPQCNGLDEKVNGILCKMISKYVSSVHNDWDLFLNMLKFAYNTSVQSSTKLSPFMVLYGRDVRLPLDVTSGEPANRVENPISYAKQLSETMPKIWNIVKKNIEKAQNKQKIQYDKKHRDVKYDKGMLVWVYKPARKRGLTDKLVHKNKGPFRIIEPYKNVNYVVESVRGPKKQEIHHVSKLSPCYTREALDSSTDERESDSEDGTNVAQTPATTSVYLSPGKATQGTDRGECSGSVTEIYSLPESPPEENVDRTETPAAIRRSARSTRGIPPIRYSPTLNLLMMLSLLCVVCDAGFHKVSPILWRHTGKPVLVGVHPVQMAIRFYSPCDLLSDKDLLPNGSQAPLFNWCNTSFYSDFLRPVRRMCKPAKLKPESLSSSSRDKRLVLEIGLGIIAIGAAASIGLSAVAVTKTSSLSDQFNDMERQNRIMMENLRQVTANDLVEKLALKRLKTEIAQMSDYVNDLSGTVGQIQRTLPTALIVMSKLGAQFVLTRNLLYEISRKWENNEIDPQLFNVFNVTLPCEGQCPLKYAQPKSCSIDESKNLIVIHFDLRVTQPRAHVLAADPFILISVNESSNTMCSREYAGPNLVVYDESLDCIVPTKGSNLDFANDLILKPDETYCNKRQVKASDKYWVQKQCESLDKVLEDDVVQVKSAGDSNFIYCNTFNIKLYEKMPPVACPDYVFSVPSNRSFRVGRLSYSAERIKINNDMRFAPDLSQRINFQILPQINKLDLVSDNKAIDELIDSINTDSPTYVFSDAKAPIIAIFSGIALIIALFAVYYGVVRKQITKIGNSVPKPEASLNKLEEIELLETVTSHKADTETKPKVHRERGKQKTRDDSNAVESNITAKI
jgi:hypothetical protein